MSRKDLKKVAFIALLILSSSVFAGAAREVSVVLDLSGKAKFFDLPFPDELRKAPDGTILTDNFPNPAGLEMIKRAKRGVAAGYGFSTGPVIYFRFTGKIDETRLQGMKESLSPNSTLFLIDIDPQSPEFGRRFPVMARFYKTTPSFLTHASRLLAIMPVPGFVLRENTLYAAGVLCSLGDERGRPLASLQSALETQRGKPLFDRAQKQYGSAFSSLEKAAGIKPDEIAALAVFRTGDPTARMVRLFNAVSKMPPLEIAEPFQKTREYELYTVLEGAVLMPQFQDGTPPYGHGKGGRIHFDDAGRPVIQRMERVPVCLTIPKEKMPDAGFPLMIYIHGTAGVSTQLVDRGTVEFDSPKESGGFLETLVFGKEGVAPKGTGPAMIYAKHGIAGAGAAQPQNGERGGRPDMLTFYNFLSPEALRDNILQAAAEASLLLRFLTALELEPALCPGTDTGGKPVRFNPDLVFGMGQSLGSLILGPWGGVETQVKALIPSGNGAYWSLFMADGNAFDMKSLEKKGKGVTEALLNMDRFHPVISLITTVLAPADPFAYQPHYASRPLPGRAPKHIWASFGLHDNFFPPISQNAAILAMGLDFAGPVREPSTRPLLDLAGLKVLEYPVSLNKKTPQGKVTAVALQYPEYGPLNGHHINFQRQETKYQYGCFLETLVKEGAPVVFAPKDRWDADCGP